MLNEVYNRRILELAGGIPRLGRLEKPDASATEQEIIDHCREWIAGYKVPKSVEFRAEPLPPTRRPLPRRRLHRLKAL